MLEAEPLGLRLCPASVGCLHALAAAVQSAAVSVDTGSRPPPGAPSCCLALHPRIVRRSLFTRTRPAVFCAPMGLQPLHTCNPLEVLLDSSSGSRSGCVKTLGHSSSTNVLFLCSAGAGSLSFRFAVKNVHLQFSDGRLNLTGCPARTLLVHTSALTVVWLDTPAAEHGMCVPVCAWPWTLITDLRA